MILHLEGTSPVPPYEQIRSQITSMVRVGVLTEGARLPSIRQLANDLGLASGTVARAYRELEGEGVVVTRGRHGTVVLAVPPVTGADAELGPAAASLAERANQLGASEDSAVAAVRAAFAVLAARSPRSVS